MPSVGVTFAYHRLGGYSTERVRPIGGTGWRGPCRCLSEGVSSVGGSKTVSALGSLLRDRSVWALLVLSPVITASAGIITANGSNLLVAAVLNAAAGAIICGVILLVLSRTDRRIAAGHLGPLTSAHEGHLGDWAQPGIVLQHGSGLYPDWYFHLRLEEELDRAERYGLHFTLLVLTKPQSAETVSEWFANKIQARLRKTDLPALLDDGRLGVLLLHTQRAGALRRRLTSMPAFGGTVGFACFPEDGEDIATLMDVASRTVARTPEEERRPIARAARRKVRLTFDG